LKRMLSYVELGEEKISSPVGGKQPFYLPSPGKGDQGGNDVIAGKRAKIGVTLITPKQKGKCELKGNRRKASRLGFSSRKKKAHVSMEAYTREKRGAVFNIRRRKGNEGRGQGICVPWPS